MLTFEIALKLYGKINLKSEKKPQMHFGWNGQEKILLQFIRGVDMIASSKTARIYITRIKMLWSCDRTFALPFT